MSEIKDSAYFDFFLDTPDQHSLELNGKMQNADTSFRYRKYCKSEKVDVRFPLKQTKVHFRVQNHDDIKLGLDFGSLKLGGFEAQYFSKISSVKRNLQYTFGFSRKENEKFWHTIWATFNAGLIVNYNFSFNKPQWSLIENVQWNQTRKELNLNGLFSYTKGNNEVFFKASNQLDSNYKCSEQEVALGYLRKQENRSCGVLVDKSLDVQALYQFKKNKFNWKFLLNRGLVYKQYLQYTHCEKLTVNLGITIPLKTLGQACPKSYLTALQVELNV